MIGIASEQDELYVLEHDQVSDATENNLS